MKKIKTRTSIIPLMTTMMRGGGTTVMERNSKKGVGINMMHLFIFIYFYTYICAVNLCTLSFFYISDV